ncbi:cytochrome c oxidase subunit II [Candidatus Mesenet endosymbiont of Agriotes lineatus]|uniref:cytochrome c oxidase subunit II n=1 Tax=Candidatus Mesenet endosymbiont of Agriotes lineatus TaxID=3077948 RepID=UPI0030CB2702
MIFIKLFLFLYFSLHAINSYAAPMPWQIGFQPAATELMEVTDKSHSFVMLVMFAVFGFICLLLGYIMLRFRKKENVQASKKSHSTVLEITWTVVPLFIVAILTVSNVRLVKLQEKIPKTELTLKAIGYQWYWGYRYPEYDGVAFDSYMKQDSDLLPGEPRLLTVDHHVVLPIDTNIRLQVTAGDVIHSFAVPAFGIKLDAVPGRLNEAWFNIKKEGIYYGQCSELCGRGHGFMPIVVQAVSKEDFKRWIEFQSISKLTGEDVA